MKNGLCRGRGFLSLSREVMILPRTLRDPNQFYRLFEVEPWAPLEEIKRSYRKLCKWYHPDGEIPDSEKFLTISRAYDVLLNHRDEYDTLPEGYRWRIPGDEEGDVGSPELLKQWSGEVEDPGFFSYYYTDGQDDQLAEEWYQSLESTLSEWGYRGRVALKLGQKLDAEGRLIEVPYQKPTSGALYLVALTLSLKKFSEFS